MRSFISPSKDLPRRRHCRRAPRLPRTAPGRRRLGIENCQFDKLSCQAWIGLLKPAHRNACGSRCRNIVDRHARSLDHGCTAEDFRIFRYGGTSTRQLVMFGQRVRNEAIEVQRQEVTFDRSNEGALSRQVLISRTAALPSTSPHSVSMAYFA